MSRIRPAEGHIDSFYSATMTPAAAADRLETRTETETCVVGGGLAGLTAARELAAAGRPVVLVEAERIGWAASGRNGGFVSPGFAEGIDAVERKLGYDTARQLWDLSADGVDYVRRTISGLNPPGVRSVAGALNVIRYSDPDGLRRRADTMAERYGYRRDFWPSERVREVLRSRTYFQGLHDPAAFHIHPLNYALALAADARAKGAIFHEHTPATRLDRQGAGWLVDTPSGSVAAQNVVLAGSAYPPKLWAGIDRAVLPVATYVVVSQPMADRLDEAIRFDGCIGDTRRASDYYRIVEGGRLLWGGRITTRRSVPPRLSDTLKRDILEIYPQLGDFRVDFVWAGLMGYAVHKMPLIGRIADGLWVATAFGGHGLNTTAMAGCLIANAIAGDDDRWRLFSPYRATWGGGPLGRVSTQLAYWRLQLLDRIEEGRAQRRDRRDS
jgi:gamma-glutamylputrescine oxidase